MSIWGVVVYCMVIIVIITLLLLYLFHVTHSHPSIHYHQLQQPMIFCIENNHYGMGTSIDRHSSIVDYYKMGNKIPGIRIDGMNVLAVREGMRFAKEHCASGKGPLYVEMMTYRYHGHSMSDPGTTYRNREEIAFTRSTRDPLEFVKKCLKEANFADEVEIKEMEKVIRKEVQAEVMKAKESGKPDASSLIEHIFAKTLEPQSGSELPHYIRMPDYAKSYWAEGEQQKE
jgi:pyruvate dehydrogenase E1 component alpha subunit